MNWVKVFAQNEPPPDARKVVKVDNRTILLLHHAGQIHAIDIIGNKLFGIKMDGKAAEFYAFSLRIDCFFYFRRSLMENACPHMRLPLQAGKVTDDNAIACP